MAGQSIDYRQRVYASMGTKEADRIMRLAFGTFLGIPDPIQFMGDADFARTRWKADPSSVFCAELGGKLRLGRICGGGAVDEVCGRTPKSDGNVKAVKQ